jgi:UDP-N-acetylmuramate dehydrogenase
MNEAGIDHVAVKANVPLGPMTTYKVGGSARWFAEPSDLEELRSVLDATPPNVEVIVLGRGSNVVIADAGIDGLVVKLGPGFNAVVFGADGRAVAGAGLPLPRLARMAAGEGRAGLGFYVGIPGSVGGAVRMNAGGHGSDTASVLESARILDVTTREVRSATAADLDLGYRRSNLASADIVVQATFTTTKGDVGALEDELRQITRWRKEHQPGGTLNAGSVFKNPEGGYAGQIIDELGLKGYRLGPIAVSDVHANFMVADGAAKAIDIWVFVRNIASIVEERTGVTLDPEIRFLGTFPEDP